MFFGGELVAASVFSKRGRLWLALAVVVSLAVLATAGQASGQRGGVLAAKCAKVKVRATPKINAQNAPDETIKSKVTNCSSAKETVILTQTISGPSAAAPMEKSWTIRLLPGKSAVKKRLIPYVCCGTYEVTDKVFAKSGRRLAHARTTFTFA